MKNHSNRAILGLLLCQLLWPCIKLITHFSDLEFYFYSELLYLLLISAVTMWLCLFLYRQDTVPDKWLCLILFPVTILSCTLEVLFFDSIFTIPLSALRCISAGFVFTRFLPDRWYKYLASVGCTLLILAFVGLCGLKLIFGQISSRSIVQEYPAPDGEKYAQLIDDNQGALGGSTLVYVRRKDILSLGVGALRPDSQLVYQGSWGSFETVTVSWQDDSTLMINDSVFNIP